MREGWKIKKLAEVAEYFNGLTYSPKDVDDKGIIVLRSSNIQNDELDFSDIVRVSANIKEKLFVKEGDILMCSRNGSQRLVGKTAPILNIEEPMTFGTFMMIIRSEFSPYLLWFFKTDNFKKQISGGENTMINQVTRYMLDDIEIPLPPLTEQQRIVAILDEAFATIDKAKANAEQNLKNAKELFESYLQGVFEIKGEGWEEKTLGEIAFVKSGGTPSRAKKEYWEGDIAWYSSGELNDLYTKDPERYINDLAINNSNAKIFPKGSLLIGMYDTAALKMSIIDRNAAFNQAIAGVMPNDKIDLTFILHSINSIKPDLLNLRRGTRQKNLSLEKIKNIPIFLPPLKTQKSIVKKLDILSSQTKKIEAIYQKKLEDLEELKKSILQKAFSGELTQKEVLA